MNEQIMSCLFCKTWVNMFKYLDTELSQGSNVPLRIVLDSVLNYSMKLESESCLCIACTDLLNNLDLAEVEFKKLKNAVLSYFKFPSVSINKVDAYCQTDWDMPLLANDEYLCENLEVQLTELDDKLNCKICFVSFDSKKSKVVHDKEYHKHVKHSRNKVQQTIVTSTAEHTDSTETVLLHESEPINRTKTQKPIYKCAGCTKQWRIKKNLERHIIKHHMNPQSFICEICGDAYKRLPDLKRHIGRHNGILPFSCAHCGKAFVKKPALINHLPIHTGETRFQCDLCGKRFIHHSSLRVHKLLHIGHKSYHCLECGLALFSKSHYNRHMRVHTGEKNYKCDVCLRAFAERYNLVSHKKIHLDTGLKVKTET